MSFLRPVQLPQEASLSTVSPCESDETPPERSIEAIRRAAGPTDHSIRGEGFRDQRLLAGDR